MDYTAADIIRFENFLPPHYQESLKEFVLSNDFPLYRDPGTAVTHLDHITADMPCWKDANTKEHSQWVHSFVARGEIISNMWPRLAPMFFELERQMDSQCQILRVKLNVNTQDRRFGLDDHYLAHIDVAQKDCWTAIYYVADSDGDTLWFDTDMQIIHREQPKQGTLVLFPCRMRHAGQPPREYQYRTVINLNVRKINKE